MVSRRSESVKPDYTAPGPRSAVARERGRARRATQRSARSAPAGGLVQLDAVAGRVEDDALGAGAAVGTDRQHLDAGRLERVHRRQEVVDLEGDVTLEG